MKEIWKEIPGYKTRYEASNFGRIRSIRRKMIMNQRFGRNGYLWIRLSIGSKRYYHDVHRLVALTFISNPKRLRYISHEDNDKHNNNVSNLKWCTHQYNMQKAVKDGLHGFKIPFEGKFGYDHNRSKEVIHMDFNGKEIARYGSAAEGSRKLGLSESTIVTAIGNNNGRSRKGIFKYSA